MEIHSSALKRQYLAEDIEYAFANALVEVELDPDADPPKLLFIGPGMSGDLLELIGRELEDGEFLIHHCMKLRPQFFPLLKGYES